MTSEMVKGGRWVVGSFLEEDLAALWLPLLLEGVHNNTQLV